MLFDPSSDDESQEWKEEEDEVRSSSSEEEEDDDEKKKKKPPPSRCIVDMDQLTEAFEATSRCLKCGGKIDATIKTVCLATKIMLSCEDPKCGYTYESKAPTSAAVPYNGREDNRERMTDYAVNVLYVIGLVACGDGGWRKRSRPIAWSTWSS
jgi:hypothetical protein